MKKIITTLLISIFLCGKTELSQSPLFVAQGVGANANQSSGDSLFVNPAGMAKVLEIEVGAIYSRFRLLESIQQFGAYGVLPLKGGTLGTLLSAGNEGSVNNFSLQMSGAKGFKNVNLGMSLRYDKVAVEGVVNAKDYYVENNLHFDAGLQIIASKTTRYSLSALNLDRMFSEKEHYGSPFQLLFATSIDFTKFSINTGIHTLLWKSGVYNDLSIGLELPLKEYKLYSSIVLKNLSEGILFSGGISFSPGKRIKGTYAFAGDPMRFNGGSHATSISFTPGIGKVDKGIANDKGSSIQRMSEDLQRKKVDFNHTSKNIELISGRYTYLNMDKGANARANLFDKIIFQSGENQGFTVSLFRASSKSFLKTYSSKNGVVTIPISEFSGFQNTKIDEPVQFVFSTDKNSVLVDMLFQ